MLDEKKAHRLQIAYHITHDGMVYMALQEEVYNICCVLLQLQCGKTGYNLSNREMVTLAQSSSERFMQLYVKHPNYVVKSFRNRLYLEVKYALYSPKRRKDERIEEADISTYTELVSPTPELPEDTRYVIEDLMEDFTYWRNIILDAYSCKSYKKFILSIEKYTTRRAIYDHAERLHKLFITIHRKSK